jgi:hypothetical protein
MLVAVLYHSSCFSAMHNTIGLVSSTTQLVWFQVPQSWFDLKYDTKWSAAYIAWLVWMAGRPRAIGAAGPATNQNESRCVILGVD